MFAQCPQCLTFFRVTTEQLRLAEDKVRCGKCQQVFNALETLRDDLATADLNAAREEKAAAHAVNAADSLEPARIFGDSDAFDTLETAGAELDTELIADAEASVAVQVEIPPEIIDHLPSDDLSPAEALGLIKPKRPLLTAGLATGSVILLLVLLAQWVHAYRGVIASDPLAAEWMEKAYRWLEMPLEPRRDLDKLRILRSEVSLDPAVENALQLNGVMSNQASFAQPFPTVRVLLQDRFGDTVGGRYFEVDEFLVGEVPTGGLMEPGKIYDLQISVLDPGSAAIGYQMSPCIPENERYRCYEAGSTHN